MSDQLERVDQTGARGRRLDLSLQFHWAADGTKSGTIQIKDADGRSSRSVPLESPEAMNVALARLVLLGFRGRRPRHDGRAAGARRASREQKPSVLVAGVDGYRKGWVAVSLDPSGDVQVSTHPTFAEVLSLTRAA